jgi:hypothetical protein
MNKSTKQLLSVGFHLLVLVGMVMTYDAAMAVASKLGWLESRASPKSVVVDFRDQDHAVGGTEIDPSLAALVDQNEDGYGFRRDLPFPPNLTVRAWDIQKFKNVRVAGKSPFGEGQTTLSFRADEMFEYQKLGGTMRVTLKEKVMERLLSPAEEAAKAELVAAAEEAGKPLPENKDRIEDRMRGKVVDFKFDGKVWKSVPSSEFSTMAWGKEMEEVIEETLVKSNVSPRPRWFGSKRVKEGETMKLADSTLNLVFDDTQRGAVEMTFVGMEGVNGHPCAVFDVTGNFQLNDTKEATGEITRAQLSIQEGKIWLSLLYPVVLRSELRTIQSAESREGRKLVTQMQGEVEMISIRDWKPVDPAAAAAAPATDVSKR